MNTTTKDPTAPVQLCIRVAPALRDELHDAAGLAGVSVQALVISYVTAGLAASSPSADSEPASTQAAGLVSEPAPPAFQTTEEILVECGIDLLQLGRAAEAGVTSEPASTGC